MSNQRSIVQSFNLAVRQCPLESRHAFVRNFGIHELHLSELCKLFKVLQSGIGNKITSHSQKRDGRQFLEMLFELF